MSLRYRKRKRLGEDWHFHPNCSRWPEADYRETAFPRLDEILCSECVKLAVEPEARSDLAFKLHR